MFKEKLDKFVNFLSELEYCPCPCQAGLQELACGYYEGQNKCHSCWEHAVINLCKEYLEENN
jgi:hypothetical protein